MGGYKENDGTTTTQSTMIADPSMKTRTENITGMESAISKEFLKSGDKAKITEILTDNEKFQAHIQEIDTALNNSSDISAFTTLLDDDDDCSSVDLADKADLALVLRVICFRRGLERGIYIDLLSEHECI